METIDWKGILNMLDMEADPFRKGTDCCSTIHTCAGKYKRTLNDIRKVDGKDELPDLLDELEVNCKTILAEGYRMFDVYGRIYLLGMFL